MASISENLAGPHGRGWRNAVLFIAAALFVFTQLFEFPFTPIYFEGDHLISVSNAMRMLNGEVIYRDFFHLTPPGTELIYASLFSAFGVRIWILNFMIAVLGLVQVWLLWYFARPVLSGVWAYLPAALFLAVGFRHFAIDGTYRLYSVVFVLFAIAVLYEKRTAGRLVAAGILCGLSSFFVQTRGLSGLAAIGFFLLWENYRSGFDLKGLIKSGIMVGVPFLVTIFATHFYFAWQAGWDNYFFSLVTFLREHYPHDPLAKTTAYFSDLPDWASYREVYSLPAAVSRYFRSSGPTLFYYALIPFVYIAFLVVRWLRRSSEELLFEDDARLLLLTFAGIFLAATVSAPTGYRLYHVAVPGLVLLFWLISRIRMPRLVPVGLFAGLVLLCLMYGVQRQVIEKVYVDFPAGRSAFLTAHTAERYQWLAERVSPGDVLFEAHHPSFYFPFHLVNPTPLYVVRDSEYTPRFQIDAVMRALEANPPKIIVWNGKWSKEQYEREPGDNLGPLWEHIRANYRFAVEFRDAGDYTLNSEREIEMWERKP